MNLILFDSPDSRIHLAPFSFSRPVSEIRLGILTIREKWEKHLGASSSYLTEPYLSEKFSCKTGDDNLLLDGSVLPYSDLVNAILRLERGTSLMKGDRLIAARVSKNKISFPFSNKELNAIQFQGTVDSLNRIWEIFGKNPQAIKDDFILLTKGRKSQPLPEGNKATGNENIFIEEGAEVIFSLINANEGPVYIGKDAVVMEGSMIRGPFALCHHSALKMGAKIYGGTTIGPHSKVGGEVNNSVIFGYSNKAHDGFLGNAVTGEWCNLGADTNNSNLKNNYTKVQVYSYADKNYVNTGLQFCGLFMADHSKCGINTMFNTGTVVGVFANIFGGDFLPRHIPSFSWGNSRKLIQYRIEEAFDSAREVCKRRGVEFGKVDEEIYRYLNEMG